MSRRRRKKRPAQHVTWPEVERMADDLGLVADVDLRPNHVRVRIYRPVRAVIVEHHVHVTDPAVDGERAFRRAVDAAARELVILEARTRLGAIVGQA